MVDTRSSPIELSRKTALDAAENLLQIKGWKALTAARVAEACGMSRQWLHTLFGGQQQLVDALVDSVFGHWRAKQLELMAARQPLSETVARNFALILDSPPTVAMVLRQTMVDQTEREATMWAEIHDWWKPLWQAERSAPDEEDRAVTTTLFAASVALEPTVRNHLLDSSTATAVVIGAIKGSLKIR